MQLMKRLTKLEPIELDIELGQQKVYENDRQRNLVLIISTLYFIRFSWNTLLSC